MNSRSLVFSAFLSTLVLSLSMACSSENLAEKKPTGSEDGNVEGESGAASDGFMQPSIESSASKDFERPVDPEAKPGEWGWLATDTAPYSTASIDVDTASYALFRAQLRSQGNFAPETIRIEDFLNYFPYQYAAPTDDRIVKLNQELVASPYTPNAYLLRLGLKAKEQGIVNPPKNLVFLVDVSGSMGDETKLPLVKASLKQLTNSLNEKDSISIVSYAGSTELVLPATKGSEKSQIKAAIDKLGAGGGTNGGEGMKLAYEIASKQFISGGVNRVVMTTDGDFNVGITSHEELVKLIRAKSDLGVFLTILGFGLDADDALMENVAKDGDGNYFFIDSINEIEKVVIKDFAANVITLAKDVKVQLEFNPRLVKSYRMVGYVNRQLADEDFNDDKKDAGDLGSGQSVTYLYEIQLRADGEASELMYQRPDGVDPLIYQDQNALTAAAAKDEIATFKLRYKTPEGLQSAKFDEVISHTVSPSASEDSTWQIAVAGAALKLKGIEGISYTAAAIKEALQKNLGSDEMGLRKEFLELMDKVLK